MYRKAFSVTAGLKRSFTARQLSVMATVVGDDAKIEATNVRQLLVEMDARRADAARAALHAAGMRTYTLGAVVREVRACSFCQGEDTEGYKTAVDLDEVVSDVAVPFPLRVTYSGCPSGCAEPLLHDLGVVKADGGFRVYGGGSASGLAPRVGVLIEEGISEEDLPGVVGRIVRFYQARGRAREKFSLFLDRMGVESLPKAGSKYWRR